MVLYRAERGKTSRNPACTLAAFRIRSEGKPCGNAAKAAQRGQSRIEVIGSISRRDGGWRLLILSAERWMKKQLPAERMPILPFGLQLIFAECRDLLEKVIRFCDMRIRRGRVQQTSHE
jgi:hypothetical protein